MPIVLTLEEPEIKGILGVLGDLPSKSGAWPLMVKIQEQLDKQVKELNTTTELV